MKKLILFALIILSIDMFSQTNCKVVNSTFKANEQFNYKVYYNLGAIWVAAGEASFSTQLTTINGRPVYHFIGLGTTYTKYDWFYKVRDRYESYADTLTLKPLRFTREAHEGSSYTYDDYVFNQRKNKVYTNSKKDKKPSKLDSINISTCTNDVMTATFYVRCLDFKKFKPNDTIPISFVLDGKVYPSYIRYLGKEIITDDNLGRVRCIKFKPKLIEGTIFKSGDGMTVWLTDDENKIPLYVETEVIVGTVKVYLTNYIGLRNKMDCLMPKK